MKRASEPGALCPYTGLECKKVLCVAYKDDKAGEEYCLLIKR